MRSAQRGICFAAEAPQCVCYSRQNQKKWSTASQLFMCVLSALGPDLSGASIEIREPDCCRTAQASERLLFSQYGSSWQFLWKIPVKSLENFEPKKAPSLTLNSTSVNRELPVWLCFSPSSLLSHFLSLSASSQSQTNNHGDTLPAYTQQCFVGFFFFIIVYSNQVTPEACWDISAFMFLASLLLCLSSPEIIHTIHTWAASTVMWAKHARIQPGCIEMNAQVTVYCLFLFLKTTGISDDLPVQTPAFTNAVRLYRQAKGHYGTWDMMCGQPPQVRTFIEFIDIAQYIVFLIA